MKESNNIESLFKDKLQGLEADPGQNAWSNIQSQLKAPVASSGGESLSSANTGVWAASSSKVLTAAVALGIGGLSIAAYFGFNSAAENQNKVEKQIEVPTESKANPLNSNSNEDKNIQEDNNKEETLILSVDKPAKEKTEEQLSRKTQNNSENPSIAEEQEQSNASTEANQTAPNSSQATSKPAESLSEAEQIVDEILAKNSEQHSNPASENEEQKESESKIPSQDQEISDALSEETSIEEPHVVIPNIFTPNQDGVNDAFYIEAENFDQLEVKIFTKSGKLVHEWTGEYGFWDGEMPDGSMAANDMYLVQVLISKDGKTFPKQGFLNLKR